MESIINKYVEFDFGWTSLLLLCLILFVAFIILDYIHWILSHVNLSLSASRKKWYDWFVDAIHDFMMWYEPIVVLIICVGFVLINPIMHGLIVLFIVIFFFSQIRDYISGRFIKVDNNFLEGISIKVGKSKGEITNLKRLGVYLRETDGIKFIPYHQMLNDGYTLISGDNSGSLLKLSISDANNKLTKKELEKIKDLTILSPYLDKKTVPRFLLNEDDGIIKVNLMLVGEEFKDHYVQMLEDNKLQVKAL
jgi:hypothetical protein